MNRYPFSSVLVLCLVLSGLFTGCGGGGGSNNGGSGNGGGTSSATAPTVTSISPTSVPAGSAALTLTVNGTGFDNTTTIQVGGVADTTKYVSATQVTATVEPAQMLSGGDFAVIAATGSLTSGASPAVNLEVTNPAPAITAAAPETVLVGADVPVISIAGTGFVPTTVINVNGSARTTFFTSSTQVGALLTAADIASAGSRSLTAVNTTPGGGTSAAATVTVVNPVPNLTGLSPDTILTSASTPSTITVTGTNFVPTSTVQLNGTSRGTTYVSSTQLTFQLTATDQSTVQRAAVTVTTPAPGGGASRPGLLNILAPLPTPVISQVSPSQFIVGSQATTIAVSGTNLVEQSPLSSSAISITPAGTVMWNDTPLTTTGISTFGGNQITVLATVPASLLSSVGTASITFVSTVATPATSNAVQVSISNPPAPTLTSIYPASGPINTSAPVTLNGTGFQPNSTVAVNGVTVPSTYVNSAQLTANIPADSVAFPGNINITVTTPAPGGGTTSPLPYTAYVNVPSNDIAYNTADGLIYASVPSSASGGIGNSIVGVDPVTGNIMRTIWVGSEPNKLALSTDGKQLFVGLDGSGTLAQVDLATGKQVRTITLGGGAGLYNPLYTAASLAAVPGQPNSVAVLTIDGLVTIYDSGVARAKNSSELYSTYFTSNYGSIAFGSSSSTLYLDGSPLGSIVALTVDSTGITAGTSIYSNSVNGIIQYDNGRLYLPTGAVLNAADGMLLGTFYSSSNTAAQGPVASDSTLGRAFIASPTNSSAGNSILAFDESTFDPIGNFAFNAPANSSYTNNITSRLVRWGQNGLALTSQQTLYIFQSPVVKDTSSSPADLSLTLTAPATAATGDDISYVATIKNLGPNQATSAAVALNLDSSLILSSVTPSQGSCGTGTSFSCDLGTLAKDASATVTITAKPTTAGTLNASATVDSVSYDPTAENNQATVSTTVTGDQYSAIPSLASISPNLVQAGSDAFPLTVTGSGFNPGSTVNLNGAALTTTYVSATQLTAQVTSDAIANYGWAPVTVTNPSPGGGTSSIAPLTIYALVNVEANSILFDPFSQQIYASVPSAATSLTGNSIVAINPATASVGTPVNVGSEPNAMAETTDGNYLFVGLTGSDSIAQFNLMQQKLTAIIPVTTTSSGTTSAVSPTWIATMPGSDTTLAVDIANGWGNFGIFDISGNTGSFRTNFSGYYDGVDPVFADDTHVYAYDSQTTGAEFYRYTVDANGLTPQDDWTLNGMGGFSGSFKLANGLVYGGNGGIIDPRTTPPTQLATLPLQDFYQAGISTSGAGVVPDSSTHKDFLMLANTAGTWEYALTRYDTTTYLPEDTLVLPTSLYSSQTNWTMLRWGQDGMALLAATSSSSGSNVTPVIILLRGPFVTPQLLAQYSAATLTSSSVASVAHGAGNTLITLTGSNFAPGVAVTWNGSYRTTTIVDATHVTVAIPASDLATAGSASLTATNPGAAASNKLTITIN